MDTRDQTAGAPQRLASFAGAALRLAEVKYPAAAAVEGKPARRGLPGRTLEGLALSPKDAFELLLAWDEQASRAQGIEPGESCATGQQPPVSRWS